MAVDGNADVMVDGQRIRDRLGSLPDIEGTRINAGKKSEVIELGDLVANLVEKNPRQIFAKVPGIFVYDMDGTGNQVNIATRGLDPHRGWEFNIRKDGHITNSDMYGYPASHFSIPMEAVERIELIRGTASLQYGAQFGGMLNYVTKRAGDEPGLEFETINSVGSFGLLGTYNVLRGRSGSTEFHADYNKRISDGYRRSSKSDSQYYSMEVRHRFGDRLAVDFGYAASEYLVQLPGPLTDAQFAADPEEATRNRNYYSPDIRIPTVGIEWQPDEMTTVTWNSSAVFGTRSSVLFDRPADVPDTIDPLTGRYANRQVDIDNYHSRTSALKVLRRYQWAGREHAFAIGIEGMWNDTRRRQQGHGTVGSDYDLSLVQPGWGRDLRLESDNMAVYAENRFSLTDAWSINPGLRVESGTSDMKGVIVGYAPSELPTQIKHDFTLLGLSTEYKTGTGAFYAGYAQAYRPVLFKDIIPASPLEQVDKNLKDGRGYVADAGFRGGAGRLQWDVGVFEIGYGNRMGTSANFDAGGFYNLRTNVGDSRTRGVEVLLQYSKDVAGADLTMFTSTAWMDATYRQAVVRVGETNVPVSGNAVQSVPDLISRSGLTMRMGSVSTTLLYSYTAESYADALNTRIPSANGSVGLVPGYGLLDVSAAVSFSRYLSLTATVNNVTDQVYFTKRPEFYPGPGIWPSDGRSANVSLGIRL